MSIESKCPQCGTILKEDAPAGLCPNCLMALNLKTETVFTDDPLAAQPPLPPEQIAPHFPQLEILECLGRGGMGVVYKARQKTLNRLVALKLLAPERVNDPKFAERFTREAQALAALNHPNIVTIYEFGVVAGIPPAVEPGYQPGGEGNRCKVGAEKSGATAGFGANPVGKMPSSTAGGTPAATPLYYLLMEFVDGVNLRHLLRTRKFTPEEALAIVPPLCDALQFAHDRGIVHRDIKPENLLVDKAGRVKVADFGIAKMLGSVNGDKDGAAVPPENSTQSTVGTPGYSAPEQKTDPARVDSRADIYSLGVVFYEMLTGELPGKPIEPPSYKVHIDVRLDEVVLRALEKKPELRYQQVSEVKTCVETIVATGRPKSPTTRPDVAQSPVKMLFNFNANLPLSIKREGKRRLYWPGVLLFCSTIGFVVNAVILTIGLALWLLNVTLPHGKTFSTPSEVWSMVLWLVVCAAMRLAALKLGSNELAGGECAQAARGITGRKVTGLFLGITVAAGVAFGLAHFSAWLRATSTTALVDGNSLDPVARVVVWIAIFFGTGWFIFRRGWRAVTEGSAGVPPAASGDAPSFDPDKSANQPNLATPDCARKPWALLLRSSFLIGLVVFAALIVIALVWANIMPETYAATARIKIDYLVSTGSTPWRFRSLEPASVSYEVQQDVLLLQSEAVLNPVINELGLSEIWGKKNSAGRSLKPSETLEYLKAQTSVAPIPDSRLVAVTVYQDSPAEAAELANAIAESYRDYCQQNLQNYVDAKKRNSSPIGDYEITSDGKTFRQVQITDTAKPPLSPARPNKPLIIVSGAVVGLFLGGAVFLFRLAGFYFRQRTRLSFDENRKPDHFWRWFAVTVVALITLIPGSFLILMIGLPIAGQFIVERETKKQEHSTMQTLRSDYIGQAYFPFGDTISITNVERNETQMVVKGHYNLVSHEHAQLALNVTSSDKPNAPDDSMQAVQISQGSGDFELIHFRVVPGLPHVSMYAEGHPFASLYFGTQGESQEEREAKWITNAPSASAETWSPKLAPGEKPDLQKILGDARDLMDQGKYEEALQRQIWYFNHALEYDPAQTGVRLSFALAQWVELGRRYATAKQALLEIRGRDTRQLIAGNGFANLFSDVNSINNYLGQEDATLTLFKTIYQTDNRLAKECYFYAENLLIQHGEYELLLNCIGDPQARFDSYRRGFEVQIESPQRTAEVQKQSAVPVPRFTNSFTPPDFGRLATNNFVGQVCKLVEILVATDHKADAESIREQALNVLDDPRLKSAFSDAEGSISNHHAIQMLEDQPPVVVETFPISNARDIEPGETEIQVRFSKEMADGSWSWSTAWENSTPEFIGQPHYEADLRTCAVKVKLEPGRTYAFWLNSGKFQHFTDQEGRPAVPYLLIFQTKQK